MGRPSAGLPTPSGRAVAQPPPASRRPAHRMSVVVAAGVSDAVVDSAYQAGARPATLPSGAPPRAGASSPSAVPAPVWQVLPPLRRSVQSVMPAADAQ